MTGRWGRGERGSMAVEVVILTPVLMSFILLIVAFGRFVAINGDIEATARDAARAASMELDFPTARQAAHQTVDAGLEDETSCDAPQVGGDWEPEGEVVVRLRCRVSYHGLGLIGLPGGVHVETVSVAPLDPYRRFG